jgi:hypothetical protein
VHEIAPSQFDLVSLAGVTPSSQHPNFPAEHGRKYELNQKSGHADGGAGALPADCFRAMPMMVRVTRRINMATMRTDLSKRCILIEKADKFFFVTV